MKRRIAFLAAPLILALGGCQSQVAISNNSRAIVASPDTVRPLYTSANQAEMDRWIGRALVEIGLIAAVPQRTQEQVDRYCQLARLRARFGDMEGAGKEIALALDATRQETLFSASTRLYFEGTVKDPQNRRDGQDHLNLKAQRELLTSRTFVANLMARPEINQMAILKNVSDPVPFFKSALTITSDQNFITIAYSSPNQAEATQVVHTIADVYISYTERLHHNNAADLLKILAKEKEKAEAELSAKRKAALDFKRTHGILSFQDEKGNIVLARLSRLSELLTNTQLEVMDAKGTVDFIDAARTSPADLLELAQKDQPKETRIVIERDEPFDGVYPQLFVSRDAIAAEVDAAGQGLEKLRSSHGPSAIETKSAEQNLLLLKNRLGLADARIEEQRKLFVGRRKAAEAQAAVIQKEGDQKLVDAFVSKARRRLAMAQQRETQLRKSFEDQKEQALELNGTAAEFASLESELNRSDRLVQMLQDRIKDINVAEDTQMVSVSVIDVPRPGTEDAPRSMNQNLALIGQTQVRIGDVAGAKTTLSKMTGEGIERDTVLSLLAAALAKEGEADESAKMLALIKGKNRIRDAAKVDRDPLDLRLTFDPALFNDAANPVIHAARTGNFATALELAGAMNDDGRAAAYAVVGYFHARNGDVSDARHTFELARKFIPRSPTLRDGFVDTHGLRAVVEAQAFAGMLDDALASRGEAAGAFELREIAYIVAKSSKPGQVQSLFENVRGASAKCAIAIGAAEAIVGENGK